ncbi:MAG: hypothetical protein A2270_02520 [Elusimicrobia bacterium RIFOXYA12_FULL_51_18]|nr:MAG: hypothetical protein A2270_02520 [Elusimicrobia bacterium RIFOXYA12_FULL_51_18]OGS31288.1 MAG: hypothetical protein A2218_08105 [Elusimicrobia bacterium RIFOXYA2_FULL_53_38]
MSELTNFLDNRYPARLSDRLLIIADIEKIWGEFKPYAETTCLTEFTSGDEDKFRQRYWEILLGSYLLRAGLKLSPPSKAGGPDFRIEHNGRVIWVEAIAPGRGIKNNQVPDIVPSPGPANKVPSDKILLRYTTAIDTKFKKYVSYLDNKIVKPSEVFIIAVNYSQSRCFSFKGKSTYPAILQAVYPIGDLKLHKDGSQSITYRDKIVNENQAEIDTAFFLNLRHSGITAVLSTSRDEYHICNKPPTPIILVPNKLAANPLRPSPIKVDCEYRLEDIPNGYRLCCSAPSSQLEALWE